MKTLSPANILALGFMTFALFLGAGNIIFPPNAGLQAGENLWPTAMGFLITAVGLPLLTLVALARVGGGIQELTAPLGRLPGLILAILVYLAIGPLFATPRTATVSYEIGIVSLVGDSWQALLGYSLVYFAIVLALALKPGRLIDNIGKIITPVLLLDRKSTRLNSSHVRISYAVFCLKKTRLADWGRRPPPRPCSRARRTARPCADRFSGRPPPPAPAAAPPARVSRRRSHALAGAGRGPGPALGRRRWPSWRCCWRRGSSSARGRRCSKGGCARCRRAARRRSWRRVICRDPACMPLFFFTGTAATEIYTLSLHDALPI